jgi:hypothetical protein
MAAMGPETLPAPAGEAWRAALEAATEVGSTAVLLADRPVAVTERRMADDMVGASGPQIARQAGRGVWQGCHKDAQARPQARQQHRAHWGS